MNKHRSSVHDTKKRYFKKKRRRSSHSLIAMLKDSLNYMNILADAAPTMYMCGNISLYIEHYDHIIEYTDKKIKLQLLQMQLMLEGRALTLEYFSKDDVKVCGFIEKMEFFNAAASKAKRGDGHGAFQ